MRVVKPRLIALDLDGTLLTGDATVSVRNRAALLAAQREGTEIVIATGRRHSYARRVVHDLGLAPDSALISSNGTVIRTQAAHLLHREFLPLSTARWLCEQLGELRSRLVITFDLVDESGHDRRGALVLEEFDKLNLSISAWIRANEPCIAQVRPIEQVLQGLPPHADPPIQMMLCGTVAQMVAAEERLLAHPEVVAPGAQPGAPPAGARISLHRTQYTDRDLSIVDILPAGCSKASALAKLLKMRGLAATDVLAVGDNWNDAAMLDLAGRAVLLGNAPDDLRRVARWPIGYRHDEDGVARAIEASMGHGAA